MARLPLRRNQWAMTVILLIVPLGLCGLIRNFGPGGPPDFSDLRGVFHFQNGAWQSTPPLPEGADGLEVSANGAVWTSTGSRIGLRRLDGARWLQYEGPEFGTHTNSVPGGFAVNGAEVWAATNEGVVHFDGRNWRLYPEALKTGRPTSIAAGPMGVWVIDEYGNLAHFDGSTWTNRDLGSILPRGDDDYDEPPKLAMTGEGRLWIVWNGLWLLDGGEFRSIRPAGRDLTHCRLLGQDEDRIWTFDRGDILGITTAGDIAAEYRPRDTGISERVRIQHVAASGHRVWVATSTGLVAFDGVRWQNLGRPPGIVSLPEVALSPKGDVWVIGEPRSLARIALWVGPPLAACAAALIAIGLLMAMWLRGRAENRLAAEQEIVNAAGYLPGVDPAAGRAGVNRQVRSLFWLLPLGLVGFPLVIWAISAAAGMNGGSWPAAPAWALYAAGLLPLIFWGFGFWKFAHRSTEPAAGSPTPQPPQQASSFLRRTVLGVLWIALLLFLTNGAPSRWIDGMVPNSAFAGILKLVIFIIVVTAVVSGRDIAAQFQVRKAWRIGDYDSAIRILRRLAHSRPTGTMLYLEGVTHSLAGRLIDAERCLREALAKGQALPKSTRTHVLNCLGEVLTDLERYDEAQRCLQAVVDMGDKEGTARVGIAELLLAQGVEPQRALDLIDTAMRNQGQVARKLEPGRLAHRAWALALLGRRREAQDAIDRAWKGTDLSFRPVLAIRHWTVGMALLAMERTNDAIDHFRKAREADPQGKYGARALQQLKLHSAGTTGT